MNRLTLILAKLFEPRVIWLLMLLATLALALAAGAPEGGGCGSMGCRGL